jgi:hypothetical protein
MKILDEYPTVGLDPVDTALVESYAKKVMELIDLEDEETIEGELRLVADSLSNDEGIEMASILQRSSPGGTTRKTYVSIYNEYLRRMR